MPPTRRTDAAPWHTAAPPRQKINASRTSFELFMADGTPLAVDLYLPERARRTRIPTILYQTRYFRAFALRKPFEKLDLSWLLESQGALRQRFLARGFAWVDVCLRGSGASGGVRPHPWSPQEINDGRALLDWICAQPWSNQRVGALGTSYSGASAELLASLHHPALRAISPRFAPFDIFPDILAPGGIRLSWFTKRWGAINAALDSNALPQVFNILTRENSLARAQWLLGDHPQWLPLIDTLFDKQPTQRALSLLTQSVVKGVRPAHPQPDVLSRRLSQHRDNLDIAAASAQLNHRDDQDEQGNLDLDAISPHTKLDDILQQDIPALIFTGWYDGAYSRANALRFYNHAHNPNTRLIIGPWEHLGAQHIEPDGATTATRFDHAQELLPFFESTLAHPEATKPSSPRVRYFVQGAQQWREADAWPPKEATPTTLYLGMGHTLTDAKPARQFGSDRWRQDLRHGTGKASRWRSLISLSAPIHYPDRRAVSHLVLSYTSAALTQPMVIAGHPLVTIWAEPDRADFDLFVYLEDVAPNGAVHYITEGCLRASHRKLQPEKAPYKTFLPYRTFAQQDLLPIPHGARVELVIDLLPVAYRFAPGHKLRLSLAGTDADHFSPPPLGAATLEIQRHLANPSRIELPVLPS